MIEKHEKENFETLKDVFQSGQVALVETTKVNGSRCLAIVAVQKLKDGQIEMVPFAELFTVNPYDILVDPIEAMDRAKSDAAK